MKIMFIKCVDIFNDTCGVHGLSKTFHELLHKRLLMLVILRVIYSYGLRLGLMDRKWDRNKQIIFILGNCDQWIAAEIGTGASAGHGLYQ